MLYRSRHGSRHSAHSRSRATLGVDRLSRSTHRYSGWFQLGLAGLSLRPELLYVQQGVRATSSYAVDVPTTAPGGTPEIITVDATVKVDYLEVPALLQFDVPTATGVHPAVYIGPSVAYRVRCRTDLAFSGQNESMACGSSGDDFRKYDVSGVVGGVGRPARWGV